ncbi:hypothetical protein SAMN05216390_11699 [Lachnospiraceae bacterium KH1T2]|nr:hypothetical protein SAMN05216390_11699 [Lachnospiraceae bacterium KH1T2]
MGKISEGGEINMTYSGILHDKNGDRFVRIRFERISRSGKVAFAEAIVPSGKITANEGFDQDEIRRMAGYLKDNKEDIMSKAFKISSFMHIFK